MAFFWNLNWLSKKTGTDGRVSGLFLEGLWRGLEVSGAAQSPMEIVGVGGPLIASWQLSFLGFVLVGGTV